MKKTRIVIGILALFTFHFAIAGPSENRVECDIDTELGEEFEGGSCAGEVALAKHMAESILTQMKIDTENSSGANGCPYQRLLRGAHAKSHGCVQATFQIDNSVLPSTLREGVFAQDGRTFNAWMRFSNNNSLIQPDATLDLRGLAIKLLDVEGPKILSEEEDHKTQDFTFLGTPTFPTPNNEMYSQFLIARNEDRIYRHFFLHDWSTFYSLTTAMTNLRSFTNPADIEYFSATPFRLGARNNPHRRAIQYGLTPVPCHGQDRLMTKPGNKQNPNYLMESLAASLQSSNLCFDFWIQPREPEHSEIFPVENSSIFWPRTSQEEGWYRFLPSGLRYPIVPAVTVAHITIPQQGFQSSERQIFCENLVYTPWQSLPEHRPLGRTNRARKYIYEVSSQHRGSAGVR